MKKYLRNTHKYGVFRCEASKLWEEAHRESKCSIHALSPCIPLSFSEIYEECLKIHRASDLTDTEPPTLIEVLNGLNLFVALGMVTEVDE